MFCVGDGLGTIKIYSRNSENNTGKYPDIIQALPDMHDEKTTSAIIDTEVRVQGYQGYQGY